MDRYFIEYWFRGEIKDYLKTLTNEAHPHMTLVRPFYILTNESQVQNSIVSLCKEHKIMSFTLEGKAKFDDIWYIPVTNCKELLDFDSDLELALSKDLEFAEKLNSRKIFHVTAGLNEVPYFPKSSFKMNILTVLKDKKIWFGYDFETKEILFRKQMLNLL